MTMLRAINAQEEYVVSTRCGLPLGGAICTYYRKASEDEREATQRYQEHLEVHSKEDLHEFAVLKGIILISKRLIEEERVRA